MEEIKMKVCSKCGGEFPATEEYFYLEKGKLRNDCKECRKSIYKNKKDFNFNEWYKEKRESFKHNWKYEDLKWIYDNYYYINKQDLLNIFPDKSYKTTHNIISQWDIRKENKNDYWSQDDIDMLYMYYPNSEQEELIEIFDRSWIAIKMKASRIGVQRSEDITFKTSSKSHEGFKHSLETRIKQSRIRKGSKSSNWRGGISTLIPFFRGQIYEWKLKSLEKYDFKCTFTNENKGDLQIHHLHKSFIDILCETFDILNMEIENTIENYTEEEITTLCEKFLELHYYYGLGIPLTKNIHKLYHVLYGVKNNTPEQFEEFKIRYRVGEFDKSINIKNIV